MAVYRWYSYIVCGGFLNIYVPRFTGEATDGLTAHTLSFNGLLKIIAAILIAGALIAVGRFLWRFFLFGAARKIQYEIRNDMFMHLEQMSVEYYNEHKTGDLMSRFINDLNSIRMAIGMAVISAFDATVMAVMVICQMIFYVDLKLTLLAIIPMIFILQVSSTMVPLWKSALRRSRRLCRI